MKHPAASLGRWLRAPVILLALLSSTAAIADEACPASLDHQLRPLAGATPVSLCEAYRNKVVLVVNTASRCGFTPQFAGLEALYREHRDRGLVVLGFPSNDFRQELSEESEIQGFCELNYGVSFPMFQKIHVRGRDAHPFYRGLAAATGVEPRWNFYKYLIGRDGSIAGSWPSMTTPDNPEFVAAIETLLAAPLSQNPGNEREVVFQLLSPAIEPGIN
jgi:glutathione peroxidase